MFVLATVSAYAGFIEVGAGVYNEVPTVGFVLSPELKTDFIEGKFRFDFFASFSEGELSLLPFIYDNPVYFRFGIDDFSFEYHAPAVLKATFVPFKKSWNVRLGFMGGIWNGENVFFFTEKPVFLVLSNDDNYHIGLNFKVFDTGLELFVENEKPGVWLELGSLKVGVSNWIGLIFEHKKTVVRFLYDGEFKPGLALLEENGWIFINSDYVEGSWKVGRFHAGGKIGKENWAFQISVEF